MDNKHIKNSDSSKILEDKFLKIPWYDWRKFLANEEWAFNYRTGFEELIFSVTSKWLANNLYIFSTKSARLRPHLVHNFLLIKIPSIKAEKVKSGTDKYFKNKYYKPK